MDEHYDGTEKHELLKDAWVPIQKIPQIANQKGYNWGFPNCSPFHHVCFLPLV